MIKNHQMMTKYYTRQKSLITRILLVPNYENYMLYSYHINWLNHHCDKWRILIHSPPSFPSYPAGEMKVNRRNREPISPAACSPAHVEVIVAPAGPRHAAGRLPERAGVVDERPEEDGARDGAEEPHHDPLQAQREGAVAVRNASGGRRMFEYSMLSFEIVTHKCIMDGDS